MLTSGGMLPGDTKVEFAPGGKPAWAMSVAVEDGEIVLYVKPMTIKVMAR